MYDYNEVATTDKIPSNKKESAGLATNENFYKKVTLQYKDGRLLTGYTNDFFPNIPFFHLFQPYDKPTDKDTIIYLDELKRISFDQNSKENIFHDTQHHSENKGITNDKVEIVFKDGEVLRGTIIDYRPNSFGFFLWTDINNVPMKAFVISSAMRKILEAK